MGRKEIRDNNNNLVGYIDTQSNGMQEAIYDKNHRRLGYYDRRWNATYDFYHTRVSKGNTLTNFLAAGAIGGAVGSATSRRNGSGIGEAIAGIIFLIGLALVFFVKALVWVVEAAVKWCNGIWLEVSSAFNRAIHHWHLEAEANWLKDVFQNAWHAVAAWADKTGHFLSGVGQSIWAWVVNHWPQQYSKTLTALIVVIVGYIVFMLARRPSEPTPGFEHMFKKAGGGVKLPHPTLSSAPSVKECNGNKPMFVVFDFYAPQAENVSVAGSFNDWKPENTSLKKNAEGNWEARVKLPPGRYEYKYLVDGAWMTAQTSAKCVPDKQGGWNSVLNVGMKETDKLQNEPLEDEGGREGPEDYKEAPVQESQRLPTEKEIEDNIKSFDVMPGPVDVTWEQWLLRLALYGKKYYHYKDTASGTDQDCDMSLFLDRASDDGLIPVRGEWQIEKIAPDTVVHWREFYGDSGRKEYEELVVKVDFRPEIKKMFEG